MCYSWDTWCDGGYYYNYTWIWVCAVIFFIIVAVVAFIQNRITTSKEVEA